MPHLASQLLSRVARRIAAVGYPEAGERSAVIYTLLGSCWRNGINPFDYFNEADQRPDAVLKARRAVFTAPACLPKQHNSPRIVLHSPPTAHLGQALVRLWHDDSLATTHFSNNLLRDLLGRTASLVHVASATTQENANSPRPNQ